MIWTVHKEQNSFTLTSPSERNVTVHEHTDDPIECALYGLSYQYYILLQRLEQYNLQPEIQYVLDILAPELIVPGHDYVPYRRVVDRQNREPTFAAKYSLPNLDDTIEQYLAALPTTITKTDKEQVQAVVTDFLVRLFRGNLDLNKDI